MNQKDVFAGAQIVRKHPILQKEVNVRSQYYAYLEKLIRLIRWEKRKYIKAQLSLYRSTLDFKSASRNKDEDWSSIRPYCCLLPFDLAAIAAYNKNLIKPELLSKLTAQICSDLELSDKENALLGLAFSAALGDSEAGNILLKNKTLGRQNKTYLRLAQSNLTFIQKRPYPILITATMSAGKSTLINAFAGKNITLMQNMAATSKIHTILSKPFEDGVTTEYDSEISLNASKEELLTDNEDNRTARITVSTYFQGPLGGQRMILYDSPGVNSSENVEHMGITNRMLRSRKYRLLLYVMNATQLATTDEEEHLRFVAKTIGRCRILFVLNKIDHLVSEEEDIAGVIERQRDFLIQRGFEDPAVCPVSARAAYLVKKGRQEELSRIERRELESLMDKFEQNSTADYYEKVLGCPAIPAGKDEEQDLYRNCGFAYLENIIRQNEQ